MKKTGKKRRKTVSILSKPFSFAIIVGAIGAAITGIIKAFTRRKS